MEIEALTCALEGIRTDGATKKGSVIDVIKIITRQTSSSAASTALDRIPELGTRCTQLKINGKGKLTPVADTATLLELVWVLPGEAAKEFRRQCARA